MTQKTYAKFNFKKFEKITREFRNALQKRAASKNFRCLYPECNEKSVNSHSISKKISLASIAEEGKLITSYFKRNDHSEWQILEFKHEGINKATTFKGFCNEHEKLFNSIDNDGIKTYRDLFLQIYRSISMEIFKKENLNKVRGNYFPGINYENEFENNMSVNSQKIHDLFFDLLFDFPESSTELPFDKNKPITISPFNKHQKNPDYSVVTKKIPIKIPASVQNLKTYKNQATGHYSQILTIIIPSENCTTLIIVCHNDYISSANYDLSSNIKILGFTEASIIADSLFFITPSVIEGMAKEKRKLIEEDYWFFTEFQNGRYDVSIFDELRKTLAENLPETERKQEIEKINFTPKRMPHEERTRNLQIKLRHDQFLRLGLI